MTNLNKQEIKDKMKQIEDDMLPFGFIDSGDEEQEVDDEGDVWQRTEDW